MKYDTGTLAVHLNACTMNTDAMTTSKNTPEVDTLLKQKQIEN